MDSGIEVPLLWLKSLEPPPVGCVPLCPDLSIMGVKIALIQGAVVRIKYSRARKAFRIVVSV